MILIVEECGEDAGFAAFSDKHRIQRCNVQTYTSILKDISFVLRCIFQTELQDLSPYQETCFDHIYIYVYIHISTQMRQSLGYVEDHVNCKVVNSCKLGEKKNVNVPG